jgi:hypothetical protein
MMPRIASANNLQNCFGIAGEVATIASVRDLGMPIEEALDVEDRFVKDEVIQEIYDNPNMTPGQFYDSIWNLCRMAHSLEVKALYGE